MTSRKAILYTLRELGRRAGATEEWIQRWRVAFGEKTVTLFPEPDSEARIVFPFDASKAERIAWLKTVPASRYQRMQPLDANQSDSVSDVVVLFEDEPRTGMPLFEFDGERRAVCSADILTSALWTLSRVEEFDTLVLDEHQRFPAAASAAYRAGCIERPIVDEYGLALRQVLSTVLPRWNPSVSRFRFKLSHDVDLAGLPRRLRSTVGHLYPRRLPKAFVRDVLSAIGIGVPAYLDAVLKTARISEQRRLHSSFYWQACSKTQWDSGYDLEHPQIRAVIETLMARGVEMGVHPGYESYVSEKQLQEEVSRVRRIVGDAPMGGRQHFLRWRPETWRWWEKAGLAYDSSVGFADGMGFRAGTSFPYHPWLIMEDRESTLLEIPLIVMDCTPVYYMQLRDQETLARIAGMVRRVRSVGGVFTLLWHNASVIERAYARLYLLILDLLEPAEAYDWKRDLNPIRLPRDIGETNRV